eukprot:Opistho-2@76934
MRLGIDKLSSVLQWLSNHVERMRRAPFAELIPTASLADRNLTSFGKISRQRWRSLLWILVMIILAVSLFRNVIEMSIVDTAGDSSTQRLHPDDVGGDAAPAVDRTRKIVLRKDPSDDDVAAAVDEVGKVRREDMRVSDGGAQRPCPPSIARSAGMGGFGRLAARKEPIRVNDYFDRVFYVNFNKDENKRDRMRAQFQSHGITAERFPLLDPRDPAVAREHYKYMREPLTTYETRRHQRKLLENKWYFAYLKTCAKLIAVARQRGYRRILLTGDNVLFHKSFNAEFDRKVRLIPDDRWRVLYLGASQFTWTDVSLTWIPELQNEFYHPLLTDGSFAVGLDSSVFDILLFEIGKSVHTFDSGALRAVLVPFHTQAYVFYPNLIVANIKVKDGDDVSTEEIDRTKRRRWDMAQYLPMPAPMPLPKVCVVMTMKNSADTVEYSVRSILGQTYPHVEVVAVDDTSDDNSFEILQRIASQDPRLTPIRNPTNKGTYISRNIGIDHCTGDVYMNQDADDVSVPNRIALQISPIIDNRADVSLSLFIRSHLALEDLRMAPSEVYRRAQTMRVHRQKNKDFMYCCREKLGLMTTMVRMSVFQQIGRFDETRFSGDLEFMERYMAKVLNLFISDGLFNAHTYLSRMESSHLHPYIDRLDSTLLIAADLNTSLSRTVPVKGDERQEYESAFRLRLIGDVNPLAKKYNPF